MTETSYADRYLAVRDETPLFLKIVRSNPSMLPVFGMEGFAAPARAGEAVPPEPAPVPAPEGNGDVDDHPWLRQIDAALREPEPDVDATVARFNQAHDEQPADEDVWQSSELPGQAEPVASEPEPAVIPVGDAPTEAFPEMQP